MWSSKRWNNTDASHQLDFKTVATSNYNVAIGIIDSLFIQYNRDCHTVQTQRSWSNAHPPPLRSSLTCIQSAKGKDYCVPSGMVTCCWVPPPVAMESGQKRCSGRFCGVFFLAFGVSEELASNMGCRIRLRAFINLQTRQQRSEGTDWHMCFCTFWQMFCPCTLGWNHLARHRTGCWRFIGYPNLFLTDGENYTELHRLWIECLKYQQRSLTSKANRVFLPLTNSPVVDLQKGQVCLRGNLFLFILCWIRMLQERRGHASVF